MFSMEITDTRAFMNHLLSRDTFDRFLIVEAIVRMEITYRIDARWNRDFFDTDEAPAGEYCSWAKVRPKVYDMVKGRRLPSSMKILLTLPDPVLDQLFGLSGEGEFRDSISGVHLNILYKPKSLRISSGLSSHGFLMDRRPEQTADDALKAFLKKRGIC